MSSIPSRGRGLGAIQGFCFLNCQFWNCLKVAIFNPKHAKKFPTKQWSFSAGFTKTHVVTGLYQFHIFKYKNLAVNSILKCWSKYQLTNVNNILLLHILTDRIFILSNHKTNVVLWSHLSRTRKAKYCHSHVHFLRLETSKKN